MICKTLFSSTLVFAVASCATLPAAPPSGNDRVIVTSETRVLLAYEGTGSSRVLVKASREKVLAALTAAYSNLGIDVKLYDPGTGRVGNRSLSRTNRVAGERISTFLGCGMMVSGEAADNYRVTMSVVSQATPADGGSTVETWLTAAARDLGTSSGNVSCASKGTLERKINQLVLEHIARQPN